MGFVFACIGSLEDAGIGLSGCCVSCPVFVDGVVEFGSFGSLAGAEWSAYVGDYDWLPEGESYLTLVVDEFSIDRPCCEVKIENAYATFALLEKQNPGKSQPIDGDETGETQEQRTSVGFEDLRENPTDNPTSRSPIFVTPETLTDATVEITFTVELDTGQTITQSEFFDINLR